jgi:steroid 5-alpha reductase family enzyme
MLVGFPHPWIAGLPVMLVMGLIAWVVASVRRNAGLIDIFWSGFFLAAIVTYVADTGPPLPRTLLVLALVAIWALRLSAHLAVRNWNAPEDRRYRDIRARNEPGFLWKSLYLVFGLQAVIAWLISAPLAAVAAARAELSPWDAASGLVVAFGITFEAIADAQLSRFKADTANAGRVLDTGLWRYSRHPNYFGEFCVWWGLFGFAAASGGWWAVFSPLAMSGLLLKVSGVSLLEKDIAERRPEYRRYIRHTNAFFPGPARSP